MRLQDHAGHDLGHSASWRVKQLKHRVSPMRYGVFVYLLLAMASACAQSTQALPDREGAAVQPPAVAVPPAQQGAAHAAAFDRADRRARAVIAQIRCAQRVAALRSRGSFGPLDSLGRMGQCAIMDGRYIGLFFDADRLFSGVSRISAVDILRSTRYQGPIDTGAVLAVGRATSAAQLRGAEAYERAQREYAPIAIRFDGDSIEVWLVPPAVLTGHPLTVGGERGYVFTPNGRTLVGEIDSFDLLRTLAFRDTGVVRIPSREHAVPSLSELVVANLLHGTGRRIAIEMPHVTAALIGDGRSAVWVHAARKP